jgi:hypothetical protein
MLRSSIAGILVLLPVCLLAQKTDDDGTRGTKIPFHVTSVRQEDLTECDPDKCSSKKYTIEGYADGRHTDSRTAYVLTCTEALVYKPTPHVEGACARVHANADYDVRLFADSISFWPEGLRYTNNPTGAKDRADQDNILLHHFEFFTASSLKKKSESRERPWLTLPSRYHRSK